MAGERALSFNDIASLVAHLEALPAVHDVRGFSVDMQTGKITAPLEFKNGNIIEIYSDEVIRRFQEILEKALVLRMQLFLLEKLSALPENQEMASFIQTKLSAVGVVTPQAMMPILTNLQRKEGMRSFVFFSQGKTFGGIGQMVNDVLSQHNLNNINSLSAVETILKQIHEKIQLNEQEKLRR